MNYASHNRSPQEIPLRQLPYGNEANPVTVAEHSGPCHPGESDFEEELRMIIFPGGCSGSMLEPIWDEAWSRAADPSGRAVTGVHVDAYSGDRAK